MAKVFERFIELDLKGFSPEEAKATHIRIARETISSFIARQEAKPTFTIETDGNPSSSEDSVRPYGVIIYNIQRLNQVGKYILLTAREISPVRSGRYKRAWFILADGQEVSDNNIPPGARELVITNDEPYSRKIERRGARLVGVPPGIVERVRQMAMQKYGSLASIQIKYITLGKGVQLVNPIHRRSGVERELTYPALVIRAKI